MILEELKLENFRGYKEPIVVTFERLTVLVGRNDAGKSTLLDALDIFFNDALIEKDDASVGGDAKEVKITCVFSDLPQRVVLDTDHPTTLSEEYLTREDGLLEITRVFNCTAAKGKQSAVFAAANHPSTGNLDNLHTLTITQLKALARQQNTNLESVNESIKSDLRMAIWEQAESLNLTMQLVDLTKNSGDTAWQQIKDHLPIYALFKSDRASTDQDGEAQDPMKAVIKETIRQYESNLNEIVDRISTELEAVADATVAKIQEMSPDLANSLNPHVATKPWSSLFSVNLSGEDGISINKRGSGTRRLILLNFFRARAENDSTTKGTGTIYAVEEPETSQHPNHQLMLLEAFNEITSTDKAQVILTTHTPNLARKVSRESLRFVTKDNAGKPVVQLGAHDDAAQGIKTALGILADHDIKVFVGVEGKWDIEFFKRISKILHAADGNVPCLETAETDGHLVFIPLGGSSLELWTSRLANLNRPEIYITDRDNAPPAQAKYQQQINDWNARGNCEALCTTRRELENYLHPDAIRQTDPTFPQVIEEFSDVPQLLAEARHSGSESRTAWADVDQDKKKKKISKAKASLNRDICDQMTSERLTQSDPNGEIASILQKIAVHLAS